MSEDRLVRAMKGIAFFISFVVMGAALPDMSVLTMVYLNDLGFSTSVFSALFVVSGFINLLLGLFGLKWNALFFAVWIMYSIASLFGHIAGSGTPIFVVSAYLLLSVLLILDCLVDTGLLNFSGRRVWHKKEQL